MKTTSQKLLAGWPLMTLILLPTLVRADLGDVDGLFNPAFEPAKQIESEPKSSQAIPWSEVGAKAGAQYQGDGLSIRPSGNGAVLSCVFQKLEGEATAEGLWLASTAPGGGKDRFCVVASSVGRTLAERSAAVCETPAAAVTDESTRYGWVCDHSRAPLPKSGTVQIANDLVRFVRPGVVEEYSVSMDGVRQDFIIERPPAKSLETETSNTEHPTSNIEPRAAELRIELDVSGARVEATAHGARLVLEGSGRAIAYSRLRVTDATGRELPARMEVMADGAGQTSRSADSLVRESKTTPEKRADKAVRAPGLAILVNGADAVYPLRIDPTFSDENWISMGGIIGANDEILSAVADGSGNLYIGGDFSIVGDVLASRIAKWNGTNWSALGSGVNSSVKALAVQGTDLYAGGNFTTAGSNAANYIAKWDGTSWSALGSGLDTVVRALVVSGSDVYAGGAFTRATNAGGTVVTVNRVAKWNGSDWSAMGLGLNDTVLALAVSGSDLYAGGYFSWATNGGGAAVAADHIAKCNGTDWSALGSGIGGSFPYVHALAISGSNIYAGGDFSMAGGSVANRVAKWDGSNWSSLGSGIGPNYWHGVRALAIWGDDLYAGGYFTMADGNYSVASIAKWNGSSWSALGRGITSGSPEPYVYAFAVSGTNLHVFGSFGTAGGVAVGSAANWDGSRWSALRSGTGPNNGQDINALAVSGSDLYAGGSFWTVNGVDAHFLAKWDGSHWSRVGGGLNGYVSALTASGSNVYVGGDFIRATNTDGTTVTVNRIAKWDGNTWSALGPGTDGTVLAIAVLGADIYAGGVFSTAGGTPAKSIAKWDGISWSALGSGMGNATSQSVNALAVSGNDLYVGGNFGEQAGAPGNGIAKWDGSNWSTLGSGTSAYWVSALVMSGSDLYAGGHFPAMGGITVNYIAKWDGSTWSALGSGLNATVHSLAVSDSEVYAGGGFTRATNAGGSVVTVNRVAKWDGSNWSALGSGIGGVVSALAVLGGDMYAGGNFTTAGGKVSAFLAKAVVIVPANVISQPFLSGGDFVARFDGTPGITYTIEQTPAASPANWQKLINLTAPTNDTGLGIGVFELRDALQPFGQRFYRAVYPAY